MPAVVAEAGDVAAVEDFMAEVSMVVEGDSAVEQYVVETGIMVDGTEVDGTVAVGGMMVGVGDQQLVLVLM
jgi:hypothetical protein